MRCLSHPRAQVSLHGKAQLWEAEGLSVMLAPTVPRLAVTERMKRDGIRGTVTLRYGQAPHAQPDHRLCVGQEECTELWGWIGEQVVQGLMFAEGSREESWGGAMPKYIKGPGELRRGRYDSVYHLTSVPPAKVRPTCG